MSDSDGELTFDKVQAEVEKRSLHQEFRFPETVGNAFYDQLVAANLQSLNRVQVADNEQFVQHFYINAKLEGHMNNPVFRGTKVTTFTLAGIRRYFNLPNVPNCAYKSQQKAFKNGEIPFPRQEIRDTLIQDNSDWDPKYGGPQIYLQRLSMHPAARAWLLFICHNILPSSHGTDIPSHQAHLIYLLMKNERVDVAGMLYDSLKKASEKGIKGQILLLPHLISQMYKKAGVPELDSDIEFDPENVRVYSRLGFGRNPVIRQAGPPPPRAAPARARNVRRHQDEASSSQAPPSTSEPLPQTSDAKLDLLISEHRALRGEIHIIRDTVHTLQANFLTFQAEVRDNFRALREEDSD